MGPACLDMLARSSGTVLDAPHTAVSTWFTGAADAHLFESIVAIAAAGRTGVAGTAVINLAPTRDGQGCESSTVQVYPSARTCGAIRAELLNGGQLVADFAGTPLIRTAAGLRTMLMPTPGNGCVIVAVGLMRER